MKKISLAFVIIFGSTCGLIAQNKSTAHNFSLEGINTIVLTLSDEGTVETSRQTESISVNSSLSKKGFLLGWRERKENSPFKINTFQKNDTLFVEDPKNMEATRGISLGAGERITTNIVLPEGNSVIINKAGKLRVYGQFKKLTTQNISRLELNDLNKKELKSLVCEAQKLKIDGTVQRDDFSYEGTGSKIYGLQADKIVFHNFKFHQ